MIMTTTMAATVTTRTATTTNSHPFGKRADAQEGVEPTRSVSVLPEGEWYVLTAPSRLLARGPGRFPLQLVAEDRAPVPVLGEGHAALDADPDPLLGWFRLASEESLQQ